MVQEVSTRDISREYLDDREVDGVAYDRRDLDPEYRYPCEPAAFHTKRKRGCRIVVRISGIHPPTPVEKLDTGTRMPEL